MDIIETRYEQGWGLKVTRSLDRTNVADLDKALALLWGKEAGPIFLDIGELQSIDSAGLTLMLRWHRKALGVGRPFTLVFPSSFHLKLLEITRLDEELVVLDEPGGVRVRRAPAGIYARG